VGDNNHVCTSHCFGNYNRACTSYCVGPRNPLCTSNCQSVALAGMWTIYPTQPASTVIARLAFLAPSGVFASVVAVEVSKQRVL
jgi:hypothetical protein